MTTSQQLASLYYFVLWFKEKGCCFVFVSRLVKIIHAFKALTKRENADECSPAINLRILGVKVKLKLVACKPKSMSGCFFVVLIDSFNTWINACELMCL